MSDEIEDLDRRLFDDIAEHYAKKDMTSYCRIARKQRLITTIKNINKPINNILEVGCGAGFTADYLKGLYREYEGLDYSENLIAYANRYNGSDGVNFVCKNIKDFEGEKKYQVILMIGVLHHITKPKEVLVSIKEYLAEDGVLVVNEPQKGNPVIGLLRKIRKIVDPKYSSDQVEFSTKELYEMFDSCGYKVRAFPQGILSTPLAETSFLPVFIGLPLAWVARALDPVLEIVISALFLNKLAWNVVIEGRVRK